MPENMMSAEDIRMQFEQFCGSKKYLRFLKLFNFAAKSKKKLVFWLDKAWSDFTEEHLELKSLTFDQMIEIFNLCHIHLCPLDRKTIPIRKGLICSFFSSEDEIENKFPYANEFLYDNASLEGKTHVEVDWCEQCHAEKMDCCEV